MSKRVVRRVAKSRDYTCEKCSKSFTTERSLKSHHTKAPDCNKVYSCDKCQSTFKANYLLQRHLDRKTPCAPDSVPVIKPNNPDNTCMYCAKDYSSRYSLERHIKICDMKDNQTALMQLVLEQTKMIKELQENQQNAVVVNNNNTINVQQNNMINIVVCGYGDEDLSRIDVEKIKQLVIDSAKDFIPRMIESIHANPEHPEFHNIYYDRPKGHAIVFKQEKSDGTKTWMMEDMEKVSKDLTKKIKRHVVNNPKINGLFKTAEDDEDWNTFADNINIIHGFTGAEGDILDANKNVLANAKNNCMLDKQVIIN